jgi:hypothetical protein
MKQIRNHKKEIGDHSCWSFCDLDDGCFLRKYNLCPTEVPLYRSPPPNDGCTSITELRFGRRDYENVINKYSKEINKVSRRTKNFNFALSSIPHWRETLKESDPHAMMFIYTDPIHHENPIDQITGKKRFACSYQYAWNPNLLQELLLNDIDVLSSVLEQTDRILNIDYSYLVRNIMRVFNNDFIPRFKKETEEKLESTRNDDFQLVLDRLGSNIRIFKNNGCLIVARFLIELCFTDNYKWIENIGRIKSSSTDIPKGYSRTGLKFTFFNTNASESGNKADDKTNTQRSQTKRTSSLSSIFKHGSSSNNNEDESKE